MAGGLLQLVAYGAHDMYLTNDPQITFFKIVYRRHTDFSIQTFERTINDDSDFGHKSSVKIYRLGDMMTRMYLRLVLSKFTPDNNSKAAWVKRLGHAILSQVDLCIGGSNIDRQYGTWLDIWYELARDGKHDRGYAKMIGDVPEMTNFDSNTKPEYVLYIPLQFWFNRHMGLALPLVAIQYHEIYVNVTLEKKEKLIVRNANFTNYGAITLIDAGLLVDYIYLDIIERKKFATIGHEYLIEQVQYAGDENVEVNVKRTKLDFNFPTKEIIWAMKNGKYTTGVEFLCYTNEDDWTNTIITCSGEFILQSSLLLEGPVTRLDEYGNIIIVTPGPQPTQVGTWEEFIPTVQNKKSVNGNLTVTNNSTKNSLWINTTSLLYRGYNFINQIIATVYVTEFDSVMISNVITKLTDREFSIPVNQLQDTRIVQDNVFVYQYCNYGLFISGRGNPIEYALLEYNAEERFVKRNGNFFNYLQPQLHHTNQPADGINLYSFAIFPEKHQPSGTSNLSKIENIIFTVWFADTSNKKGYLPFIDFLNLDNRLYIYAFSYNVFRIISGLTGLAYNG